MGAHMLRLKQRLTLLSDTCHFLIVLEDQCAPIDFEYP